MHRDPNRSCNSYFKHFHPKHRLMAFVHPAVLTLQVWDLVSTRAESIYAGVCGYLNEQSLRCNAASMHMPPTALATVQADGQDSLLCSIKLAHPILIYIQYLTTKSADEKEERPCIHKAERA
jgi:hypothetical protein